MLQNPHLPKLGPYIYHVTLMGSLLGGLGTPIAAVGISTGPFNLGTQFQTYSAIL